MTADYTILIVDDQITNLSLLSHLLESHGFKVLAARDGEASLEIVQRARPDLILLDVMLPGMDGFEACRQLKMDERAKTIPIIFMTVLEKIEDKVRGFQVGAVDYITKPFQVEEVLARIATQLRIQSLTRQLQEANEMLERRVEERTVQLAQANKDLQAEVVERKTAEAALATERNLLRTVIDNLPDYIYAKDTKGRFILKNLADARIMGANSPDDVIGKTDFDYYPTELAINYRADDQSVLQSKRPLINREEPVTAANGTQRWVLTSKVPLQDAQGKVVGLVGIGRDITERKKAEDALRENNRVLNAVNRVGMALAETLSLPQIFHTAYEHVSQLVDCCSFGISLYDAATKTLHTTFMMRDDELLDASRFPPLVLNATELIQGRARAIVTQQAEIMTKLCEASHIIDGCDNEHAPRSALYVPMLAKGETIGLIEVQSEQENAFGNKDVTQLGAVANQIGLAVENAGLYAELEIERNQLEQRVIERTAQLNDAKERIETILNSSRDMIIFCQADSIIDQVNPAFDEAFECTEAEIYSQPLVTLAVPEQRRVLEHAFENVVQTWQPQRLEALFRYKVSVPFHGEMVLSPVLGSDQHLIGVVCSLRDISERKKIEAQLRQLLAHEMQLSELKSRYMAMAAHDLRNPLAAIQVMVGVIERYSDRMTEEQKQAKYDAIHQSIKSMSQLLNDTLTIGQAESARLKFEPVLLNLVTFSQALVEELQYEREPRIRISHQGVCDAVYLDVKLLRHIVSNLLSNALKYSSADSIVIFDTQCEPSAITFRIQDQGIGIPKADQTRLFEAFHRAENVGSISGTGLGLAIVKESVERHGGTISCESEEGVGTTFTVILPQSSLEK